MPDTAEERAQRSVRFQVFSGEMDKISHEMPARAPKQKSQERPRKKAKPSSTAFADLVDDLPEFPDIEERRNARFEPEADVKPSTDELRNRLNKRVLTGSGYQPKPYWMNSLILAGVSFALLWSVNRADGFALLYQGVACLAACAGMYSLRGAAKSRTRKERGLCLLGLLIAFVCVAGAILEQ